jgi:acetyl esterase/lipase
MKSLVSRSLWAAVAGLTVSLPAVAADKTAHEIEVIRDVPYVAGPNADERQKLDLYLPKGQKGFPVLLFLHGGGFTKGDRKDVVTFGETLARHAIGVAAAGYRLAPQAKHPEQVRDAASAFAWLRENVGRFGGQSNELFVGGHSAGAVLASLLATDGQFLKSAGADERDLRGVVALSGVYRIPETRQEIFGDEAARKAASPINNVRAGLPAFFLAFAENDAPGHDKQAREFADALKANQIVAQVFEAKGRDHGSLFTQVKDGDPTGEAIIAFIAGRSGPERTAVGSR